MTTCRCSFEQSGEKAGAELAQEKSPAGGSKVAHAIHAFERAAHAVALRHAHLEQAAELKQVGAGGEHSGAKVCVDCDGASIYV